MTDSLFDEGLIVEFESELGGKLAMEDVVYSQEQSGVIDWMDVVFFPQFTEVSTKYGELGDVLSLYDLWLSMQQPGAYRLLGCSCGYDHAGPNSSVYVSFPDEQTIVWELCCIGLSRAIEETWHGVGFMRLVFKRGQYESAVKDMIQQLRKHIALNNCEVDIAPDRCKGEGFEFFCALDLSREIERKPRFEPNTLIEIGIFDDVMHKLNQQKNHDWIGHYFSHWTIEKAFEEWMAYFRRGYGFNSTSAVNKQPVQWLKVDTEIDKSTSKYETNHFYLESAASRDLAHAAGERFAKLLQLAMNEDDYSEHVTVVYRPVELKSAFK